MNNDNLLRWTDDADQPEAPRPFSDPPWKLLVVDDDPEVHSVTRFVLNDLRIFDRPLHLVHAHNAQEARVRHQSHQRLPVTAVARRGDDALDRHGLAPSNIVSAASSGMTGPSVNMKIPDEVAIGSSGLS